MTKRLDLAIGHRLALGFGAAGLLLALFALAFHSRTVHIQALRERQTSVIRPRALAADRLESAVLYLGLAARTYVLTPDRVRLAAFERAAEEMRRRSAELAALRKDPDGTPLFAPVPALVAGYERAARSMVDAARDAAGVEARELAMAEAREALLAPVREYAALQQRKMDDSVAGTTEAVADMDRAGQVFGAALLVLLFATGWITTRSVRDPAHVLVAASRRLAAGDYAPALALAPGAGEPPKRRDELAELSQAFGGMAADLKARETELQEKGETLQAQYEEIQAQQEELQAQHEELQSQNEELQAQGEELQTQGDELRSTVERLSVSEEALREAARNKDEFLALLSHELRNPLAPIRSSLYVLERAAPGSEPALRAHAVIGRQVTQLARLVEDLLDVSRISRGKVRLQTSTVPFGSLVRHVAEDHASTFADRGIDFAAEVRAEPLVEGDPERLAQVIGNLLQNAAKFTPRGGRVRLSLEASDGRTRIRLRDTGAGMDAETLGRLFQPFMQAEVTLARTNGGLGLGLALVKGLVEMHGGTVRATSDGRERGCEFVVELPTRGEGVVIPPPASPASPPARRRVLIVEDNVDAADSLREALAMGGHEVEVAHDGAAGIAKARAFRPEVLLCDIGLPDMDGHDVARAFRREPSLRSVFLVALSGYALPEDVKRAVESGFQEHLPKPLSIERLERLLARLAAASAAPTDGTDSPPTTDP